MSPGRPNFKRIQKTASRNIASNQLGSSSGRASESIGTSRPNDSCPDASRQNASLSNASRPASPTPESDDGSTGDNGTIPRRNSRGPSRGISLDKYVKKVQVMEANEHADSTRMMGKGDSVQWSFVWRLVH